MTLDTCALLWRSFEPKALPPRVRRAIDRADKLTVSSISIWEIGVKLKKGTLELPVGLREFTNRLKQIGQIRIVPVDEAIWMDSLELAWDHRDPADRVIVATAQQRGERLATSDERMRKFYRKCLW